MSVPIGGNNRIVFFDPNTGFEIDLTIEELEDDGEGGIVIKRAIFHGVNGSAGKPNVEILPEGWTRDDGDEE